MQQLFSSPTCFDSTSLLGIDKLVISVLFLSIAALMLVVLRKQNLSTRSRVSLIYAHLTFIFMPVFILTTQTACGTFCLSCYNNMPALFAYAVPASAAASALAMNGVRGWRVQNQSAAISPFSRCAHSLSRFIGR